MQSAIGERSMRSVPNDAGINHNTILGLLAGCTWGDMATVTRFEFSLGIGLWTYLLPPLDPDAKGVRLRHRRRRPAHPASFMGRAEGVLVHGVGSAYGSTST